MGANRLPIFHHLAPSRYRLASFLYLLREPKIFKNICAWFPHTQQKSFVMPLYLLALFWIEQRICDVVFRMLKYVYRWWDSESFESLWIGSNGSLCTILDNESVGQEVHPILCKPRRFESDSQHSSTIPRRALELMGIRPRKAILPSSKGLCGPINKMVQRLRFIWTRS